LTTAHQNPSGWPCGFWRFSSATPPDIARCMTQELVQFLEGQGGRARMARGYLAQEIEVVSNEDREVPSEGRPVKPYGMGGAFPRTRPDLEARARMANVLCRSEDNRPPAPYC